MRACVSVHCAEVGDSMGGHADSKWLYTDRVGAGGMEGWVWYSYLLCADEKMHVFAFRMLLSLSGQGQHLYC